jgi:hypothetical protein
VAGWHWRVASAKQASDGRIAADSWQLDFSVSIERRSALVRGAALDLKWHCWCADWVGNRTSRDPHWQHASATAGAFTPLRLFGRPFMAGLKVVSSTMHERVERIHRFDDAPPEAQAEEEEAP